MGIKLKSRKDFRERRHRRLRRKVAGTEQRPRMCVTVSNRWIRVQLIDDDVARTLMALCSNGVGDEGLGKSVESARKLGESVGRMAIERGIESVVCDRGGRAYHGRIKALADAAREAGLKL